VEDDRKKNKLRKESRILNRTDFARLTRQGRRINNRYFVALFDENISGRTRLGITVTKKVGKAVARNQLKRYVREFFRHYRGSIESGLDVNIIVKKEASGIPSREAYTSLQNIFNRIRKQL
jgi:ribonuclease P protein component